MLPVQKYVNKPFCVPAISWPCMKLFSAIGPRMMPRTTGAGLNPTLVAKYMPLPSVIITSTSEKLFSTL